MELPKAIASAKAFAHAELGLEASAVAATPKGEGYWVLLEAVVEAEYMRQRAQRELLATYEVTLDAQLNVQTFARKEIRERGTPSAQA